MNSIHKNNKINYAVVEDNERFRDTLVGLLKIRKETSRVLEFASSEELLKSHSLSTINFLIVDYKLKKMDGISLLGNPAIQDLEIPKLILTDFDAEQKIFEALKNGATGYMFKEELYSLSSILDILLNGGAYISSTIALRVVSFFKEMKKTVQSFEELTKQEDRIIREISSGYTPQEIADSLAINISTVRSHLKIIYKKLQVNNQTQLLNKIKSISLS
ncbi:MAG TPA: response regulator transcription factor [Leptospiraceae bacterium]|nr:response regulator transcription factor [Leptospiraceae bacterium]